MPGAESLFGLDDFQITHSCRFNGTAGGGHLHRQPANDGSKRIWTLSVWVKRAKFRTVADREQDIFGAFYASNGSRYSYIAFDHNDRLQIFGGEYDTSSTDQSFYRKTSAVFRDPSAWYHIVWKHDSTDGTASNRDLLYVNGVLQDWSASIGGEFTNLVTGQNEDSYFNTTNSPMRIGEYAASGNMEFDGYMAEMHWVDGTVYAPTVFGKFDSVHGHWKPITVEGVTYGTNGFHIDFNDSGNLGNVQDGLLTDFTVVNLDAADQVLDTPTNNFAVMNPLSEQIIDGDGNEKVVTFTEGNLKIVTPRTATGLTFSSIGVQSGKWYCEVRAGGYDQTGERSMIGVTNDYSGTFEANTTCGSLTTTRDVSYHGQSGTKFTGNEESANAGAAYVDGDIIGVTIDADNGQVTFYKNNASQFTQTLTGLTTYHTYTPEYFLCLGDTSGGAAMTYYINFGQDSSFAGTETAQGFTDENGIGDFFYAPPAGFLALCTENLPEPIVDPKNFFNTLTYTGDGSSRSITGVGFKPDFLWIKGTNYTFNHILSDVVRVAGRILYSDTTGAEADYGIASFDSDGWSMSGTMNAINENNRPYVAWCWKAGNANTAFSESGNNPGGTHRANVAAGFSIVSYTGTGAAGTVAHGLGAAPDLMLIKNRDVTDAWAVYYGDNTDYLILNTGAATADAATYWNDTSPTSTVFTVNTAHNVNADGEKYIAYCWRSVEGFSKVGSYVGNGANNGPFLNTGFRPAWCLFKGIDSTSSWRIFDNKRDVNNPNNKILYADTTAAEASTSHPLDFVSNGIKIRGQSNDFNENTETHIYMAFAETPIKHSNPK